MSFKDFPGGGGGGGVQNGLCNFGEGHNGEHSREIF